MKKLLILTMLVAIGGCSKEVPREQIVMRNGLAYEVNSQTPFTGIAVDYYENGQLEYKENFKDGRRNGRTEFYYENGQLQYEWNYKDGKPEGLQESYYEDGRLRSTRTL